MGFDKKRFKSNIDENVLICQLCEYVFEDPVQVNGCQDSFCLKCLKKWLEEHSICPNFDCELAIGDGDWTNNKTLEKMLNGLLLTCSFASLGCDQVVALSTLPVHTAKCQHNPELTQACVGGCGSQLTKLQVKSHKCVEALKEKITKLEEELNAQKSIVNENRSLIYKIWLSKFPETSNEGHRQYVKRLKKRKLITDWNTETILKRCELKNFSEIKLTDNYMEWLVPTLMTTLKDILQPGSTCLTNGFGGSYCIHCFALMVGPCGKIFANFDAEKMGKRNVGIRLAGEEIFNQIEIDLNNKQLLKNGKELRGLSFDCIISYDYPIEVFIDHLKHGGRMIKFNSSEKFGITKFNLIEKLDDGTVKQRKVKLNNNNDDNINNNDNNNNNNNNNDNVGIKRDNKVTRVPCEQQ